MTWTKLPALPGKNNPCAFCPPILAKCDMHKTIAVGFGDAHVSRDGECFYDGERALHEGMEPKQLYQIERKAARDPDHDWRLHLFGPLHGEVYQRQGDKTWVLVEKNEGFA